MAKKPETKPEAEHPEDVKHKRLAERVMNAVSELNAAADEARKDGGAVIVLKSHGNLGDQKLICRVYRLTHATMLFKVEPAQP